MKKKKTLLVVDVQNDFCPGGALAVPEGDRVVPVLNRYVDFFYKKNLPIFASRDWHPEETKHFTDSGGPWPRHCIQESEGAKFHPGLRLPEKAVILSKGMGPEEDGYSVFEAFDSRNNSFSKILESLGAAELYIGGLATDYCVKQTVLDALKRGFRVKLLMDATRGVSQEESCRAVDRMLASGAQEMIFEKLPETLC